MMSEARIAAGLMDDANSISSRLIMRPEEMAAVDAKAIASGISGFQLMQNAASQCAHYVPTLFPEAEKILVVCGPGNNGGDGYVMAALLVERGYKVSVHEIYQEVERRGDAALAKSLWQGPFAQAPIEFADYDLLVDAMFGAGLSKPLSGEVAALVSRLNESNVPVLAVDLPTGVSGRGVVMGEGAVRARASITFERLKPAHLLAETAPFCGQVICASIGIPQRYITATQDPILHNTGILWRGFPPLPKPDGHKYDRGHLLVCAGLRGKTGAARLAARAGLAAGAGLVTVLCSLSALDEVAGQETALMCRDISNPKDWQAVLADQRMNALVIGPGFGGGKETRRLVIDAVGSKKAVVMDADALTAFEAEAEDLFQALKNSEASAVLTPHGGEFARLFPKIAADKHLSKIDKTARAAEESGAVVLYKGPDTVISSPEGIAVLETSRAPSLATAGSGDVLAGIIGAMLAQGFEALAASAIAVHLHGAIGRAKPFCLVAEEMPEILADVMNS